TKRAVLSAFLSLLGSKLGLNGSEWGRAAGTKRLEFWVAPTGLEPAPRGLGIRCGVFVTGCLRPPLPFFPRLAALLRPSLCRVVCVRCRQYCRHPVSSAFRNIERPGVSV